MDQAQNDMERSEIHTAPTLEALCRALQAARDACDAESEPGADALRVGADIVDLTDLPIYDSSRLYGDGVFSWDATHILTCGDYGHRSDGGWCLVPRSEWAEELER